MDLFGGLLCDRPSSWRGTHLGKERKRTEREGQVGGGERGREREKKGEEEGRERDPELSHPKSLLSMVK